MGLADGMVWEDEFGYYCDKKRINFLLKKQKSQKGLTQLEASELETLQYWKYWSGDKKEIEALKNGNK